MKRIASFFLALALAFSLTACTVPVEKADDGKIQIVATLFPYYDFARAIVGNRADVTLLLSPGREAHSFEPTPLDAVTISESDVFLYNGGEGEYWVDSMLGAAGENIAVIARMMDYVDALDEEYVEGMQGADGHDHDHEHGSHDDHDDHDHDHEEHDENCTCGCHDHDHHHHHHADEVFTSWGKETPHKFTKEQIEEVLKTLCETDDYGEILRAKGMVADVNGSWIYFDMVPGEYEIREGEPDYTGRLCVIGTHIDEHRLEELFGIA